MSGTQPPEFARIFFFLHNPFRSGCQKQYLLGRNLQLSPYIFGDEKKKKGTIKSCKLIAQLPLLLRLEQKARNLESPQIFEFSNSVVLSLHESRLG